MLYVVAAATAYYLFFIAAAAALLLYVAKIYMVLTNLPINGLTINSVNRPIHRLIPTPHLTKQLQVTEGLSLITYAN